MNYILFDDQNWKNLLPLTFTRPVCEIRCGILTLKEKWEKLMNAKFSYLTQHYLSEKYRCETSANNVLINGSVFPSELIIDEIFRLKNNEALYNNDVLIALRTTETNLQLQNFINPAHVQSKSVNIDFDQLKHPWDVFLLNEKAISQDYSILIKDKKGKLPGNSNYINQAQIYVEDSARLNFVTLNATEGPIYIGKDAEIMEGSMIRGPLALCDHAVIKMSSKIYGATTIGPYSKVGGELNNVVIQGYSNKAHDGFLGNAVLGEWCNIGADSNNSNLKNNYAPVKIWNYEQEKFLNTGLQFCGLIMGDHSKCGINTMFNTGTVVGVSANIFGAGFPRNFIPSFSWGGAHGFSNFNISKAFEVADTVMKRRKKTLNKVEKDILQNIYNITSKYRK